MEDPEDKKLAEKEKKKAEVRKRLEEEAKSKHGKKGFMTAERKKKLRNLMRQKAAEELNKDRERRALERKKIIAERAGNPKNLDVSEEKLIDICNEYHERIKSLENEKYDLQFDTRRKDMILTEFNMHLQDLKGKFVKPNLKKVRNYELKLEKMEAAAKKVNRDLLGNLKKVKSGVMSNFDTDTSGATSPATPGSADWNSKKELN